MKRRALVAGLASAAALGGGLGAAGARPQGPRSDGPADVLVVGSGLAGLSAAVSAREAGAARVVVLEKDYLLGGHSAIANGYFAAVRLGGRSRAEYEQAVRAMIADMNQTGRGAGDQRLIETLVRGTGPALQWLSRHGVVWMDSTYEALGGLAPRCYVSSFERGGYDFVRALSRAARRLGVEIRFSSRATAIARSGPNLVVTVNGRTPAAARSVVLAAGGFGDNPRMRMKYDPRLTEDIRSTANPYGEEHDTAMGDGIALGESLGAALVDMDQILTIPYSGGRLTNYVGADIYLTREGRRFVREDAPMDAISEAVWKLPTHDFWVVTDSQSAKGASRNVKLIKGLVKTADSLEEAARGMGIDPSRFKAVMARYNESAKSGRDPEFGRTMFTQQIIRPPFYYGLEKPYVHFCNGGLLFSPEGKVLRADRSVVEGLFAAGEVTGGVHGRGRLGGCSLPDCAVFGHIAGRSAAARARRLKAGRRA